MPHRLHRVGLGTYLLELNKHEVFTIRKLRKRIHIKQGSSHYVVQIIPILGGVQLYDKKVLLPHWAALEAAKKIIRLLDDGI